MAQDFVLDIIAQGAWNGGTLVDNNIYENKGMVFKGGIPVTRETIEERIVELKEKKKGIVANVLDDESFNRTLTRDDFRFLFSKEGG